jgi:hypothetical protein
MPPRRPLVPLALLVVAACDSGAPPTAPDAFDPSSIVIDGTTTGNSHFIVLPPTLIGPPVSNGTFDGSLRPRVEICEWSVTDDACVPGGATFTYTRTSGPEGEFVRVSEGHYLVNWDTRLEGIEPGKVYRASVFIVTRELGSVDYEIGETGRDVANILTGENVGLVDGRTLPFRFRIELGAVEEEEAKAEAECLDEVGDAIDCDVEVIDGSQGGSATVVQAPGGGRGDIGSDRDDRPR